MLKRNVPPQEVVRVLALAGECHAQENERWRVTGEDLVVLVEIEGDALVVTLFRGDEDEEEDE